MDGGRVRIGQTQKGGQENGEESKEGKERRVWEHWYKGKSLLRANEEGGCVLWVMLLLCFMIWEYKSIKVLRCIQNSGPVVGAGCLE